MESLRGIEALRNVPLKDICLDRNEALRHLSSHAESVVYQNIESLTSRLNPEHPDYSRTVGMAKNYLNEIEPGGLALTEKDYDIAMQSLGFLPFEQIVINLIERLFPDRYVSHGKHAGITCFNYLSDLIRIIDPKIASFDDGVHSVIEAARKVDRSNDMMFDLGTMVGESICHRGSEDHPLNFFADKEMAKQFQQKFYRHASYFEKGTFNRGLKSTQNERINAS